MDQTSQQRARLVATLWNLKQAAKQTPLPGIPYIHFNSLLRQPDYRREILDAAESSGNPELERLAGEAKALNTDESALLNPEDKRWLERRDQRIAAEYGRELDAAAREKRQYRRLAVMLAVVFTIAGAGYFAFQSLTGATVVTGSLAGEHRWQAGQEYLLDDIVSVAPGARLTIEPDVVVRGRPGSALVVTRGGFLHAKGTATQPIVFTSAQPEGRRQAGDWGGVVLLGAAPINVGSNTIEGFQGQDPRGAYGGEDPAHACGVVEYVRIEFAGFEALANNELNGLTLGGCGYDSVIDFVQVHQALDDGVEVFGGTVNLRHILITQAQDDALDWDEGWIGDLQFLITQQTLQGDNGIEADNNSDEPDALPRSRPRIYNATLIGSERGAQRAMTLRAGTAVEAGNLLASDFPIEFVDVRGDASVRAIRDGESVFSTIVLHRIGPRRSDGFQDETGESDDDNGFDEAEFFLQRVADVATRSQFRLPIASQNERSPDFVPAGRFTITPATIPAGEFWDEAALFPGAVRPGTGQPWYAGWTAFPES